MADVEVQFTQALFAAYHRAKTEAGYPATAFRNMLSDAGGRRTAKTLINSTKRADGYTALYLRQRLDLTVEAIVTDNPCWHSLFEPEELEKARTRLEAYRYKFGAAAE